MVVLPQPEGPMKETNSPSAICRLTFDSASTLPSAVSKVRETSRTSTANRLGTVSARVSAKFLAFAKLFMRTGSSRGTDRFRITAGSVAFDEPGFNDVDIGNVITKYCQTTPRMARLMFAHAMIIVSKDHHRRRS